MAFSLVEVVMALGICVFCLVALLGLFSVGMKISRESAESIETANLASLLIAQRRAAPDGTNALLSSALPVLTASVNNRNSPVYLTGAGEFTTVNKATFRLVYNIQTNASRVSQLALTLSSPASSDLTNSRTRYDVLTYVRLP